MSKYTTEVRFICENAAGFPESVNSSQIDQVLEVSWNKIFDKSWPIFSEDYRKGLCIKILKHFYFREIGYETKGLWQFALNRRMGEIMPRFNKIYLAMEKQYDLSAGESFFREYGESATGNTTGSGTHTSDSSGTSTDSGSSSMIHAGDYSNTGKNTNNLSTETSGSSDNASRFSDTPQNGLTEVLQDKYLTSITADSGNSSSTVHQTTTDDGSSSGTDNYTDTGTTSKNGSTTGKETGSTTSSENRSEDKGGTEKVSRVVSGAEMPGVIEDFILKLRDVDMMIIESLTDLFMNIW